MAYFNQTFPLQKVVVASVAQPDAKALIQDAYDNLFSQAMRIPVLEKGLYSASSPYQGYSLDQAPYSLCARNAVIASLRVRCCNWPCRAGVRVPSP